MGSKASQVSPKKSTACSKKEYQKVSFDFKLMVIEKISNGQISLNHACSVYNVSRGTLNYWIKKLSNFEQKKKSMSKNDELKKLRQRIEELEFVKDFQQDCIVEFEKVTGEEFSKKFLPDALAKEIAKRKKKLTK